MIELLSRKGILYSNRSKKRVPELADAKLSNQDFSDFQKKKENMSGCLHYPEYSAEPH